MITLLLSDFRKIALEVDDACKGEVSIYSKGKRSVVSIQNWTKTDGDRLCKDLNCGNYKNHTTVPVDPPENVWEKTFRCPLDAGNIWECEQDVAPVDPNKKLYVECSGKIEIKHMVKMIKASLTKQ